MTKFAVVEKGKKLTRLDKFCASSTFASAMVQLDLILMADPSQKDILEIRNFEVK